MAECTSVIPTKTDVQNSKTFLPAETSATDAASLGFSVPSGLAHLEGMNVILQGCLGCQR